MADSLPTPKGVWPMGKQDKALADAGAKVGFYRFMEVDKHVLSGHKLYRSSAPGYQGDDADQKIDAPRAAFLKSKGIDSLISYNHHPYPADQQKILKAAGVSYLHIKVEDFKAASLSDVAKAWDFFKKSKNTLVHCGYGWGRTGTGICAIQIYSTGGANPPDNLWGEVQGGDQVETGDQKKMLGQLRDGLKAKKIKA